MMKQSLTGEIKNNNDDSVLSHVFFGPRKVSNICSVVPLL